MLCVLFFCCYLSDALIHYPAEVHPPVRVDACVCMCTAQPTGFGKLAFYAHIQKVDAEGVGGGKLIAHSCVEGGRARGHGVS